MTEETDIARLNYGEPPLGYRIAWRTHGAREWVFAANGRDDLNQYASKTEALAAAWTYYKERRDPPGMRTRPWGFGGWAFRCSLLVTASPGTGTASVMVEDDGQPYASELKARAAAWAWYDRRLALELRLDPDAVDGEADGRECRVEPWPAILTWSDEQVAAVERWLVDSTAEMPEVLRG